MRRSAFLLLALAAALVPALANAQAPSRAFIESTHVIAPRTVGAFRLVEAHYDPAHRFSGVKLRYAPVPEPGMTVDVFVYPAGRAAQDSAVEAGMAAFRTDLANARAGGLYRSVEIGPDETFALDAAPPAAPPPADTPGDFESRVSRTLAEQGMVGRRIRIGLVTGEGAHRLQSRGYLFHRQLNYFKVRVSLPEDAMGSVEFDRFADHAARSLVATIEALNIGGCSDKTVHVDTRAEPEEAVLQMLRDSQRLMAENCAASEVDGKLAQKSRNAEVVRIDYEAGDWKSSP